MQRRMHRRDEFDAKICRSRFLGSRVRLQNAPRTRYTSPFLYLLQTSLKRWRGCWRTTFLCSGRPAACCTSYRSPASTPSCQSTLRANFACQLIMRTWSQVIFTNRHARTSRLAFLRSSIYLDNHRISSILLASIGIFVFRIHHDSFILETASRYQIIVIEYHKKNLVLT